jgi:hypothetical protein
MEFVRLRPMVRLEQKAEFLVVDSAFPCLFEMPFLKQYQYQLCVICIILGVNERTGEFPHFSKSSQCQACEPWKVTATMVPRIPCNSIEPFGVLTLDMFCGEWEGSEYVPELSHPLELLTSGQRRGRYISLRRCYLIYSLYRARTSRRTTEGPHGMIQQGGLSSSKRRGSPHLKSR